MDNDITLLEIPIDNEVPLEKVQESIETDGPMTKDVPVDEEGLVEQKDEKCSAVVVECVTKYYGKGKKKFLALDNLTMRVPHGSIYGLLGPSGCGKTTLLGCLVNRLKLDKGKVYLFGFAPGSQEAAVPGERVGYMPQELALYQEFTISETLSYFGRINQLPKLTLEDRSKFLVTFLDLPDPNRLINQLSGGQQRRVSLAAALLHEPELLVLDEPTVGVDPLLRTSIWNHLLEVSKSGNTTIVITTHYIEEARLADKVGFMRKGRMLAESSPQSLMDYYEFTSLESVFLKLCLEEGDLDKLGKEGRVSNQSSLRERKSLSGQPSLKESVRRSDSSAPSFKESLRRNESGLPTFKESLRMGASNQIATKKYLGKGRFQVVSNPKVFVSPWVPYSKTERRFSPSRNNALIIKNLIRMKRNVGFLLFSFILPAIQTILFCVTVGGTPHDLPMAVVNLDNPLIDPKLSLVYLDHVDSYIIKQKDYSTFDDGYNSVLDGTTWGLIFFNTTYTTGVITHDEDTDRTIHVYMDTTNQEISLTIQIYLYMALENTFADFVESTPSINLTDAELPLKMEEPVYGLEESSFRNFVAPGVLITTIYFMAVGLTALSFIIERKEGLLERSAVSGVRKSEVLLSHLITQTFVMIVQITLVMVFMFSVFKIPCIGNIFWVIALSFLQGICGMCFGLMVSAISKDEIAAMQLIMGTFYPILLISGIVWPIEGMPTFLRYISYVFPQTYACEGIRAVLYKGWDITYFDVYIGYIITVAWGALHLVVAMLALEI